MSASRFDERRRNHRITINKGNRLQNTCSKFFRATRDDEGDVAGKSSLLAR